MAFPREIILLAPQLASKLLDGVKTTVTWNPWIGDDGRGADAFAPSQQLRGFVSKKSKLVRTSDGRLATVMATVQFVDAIPAVTPNPGKTRASAPIDARDQIILDDGQTAPIVDIGGFNDPVTGQPFAPKVILGNVVRGN